MDTIQSILVPLDGSSLSRQAIPFAGALVEREGKITILHVVPTGPGYHPEIWNYDTGWGVDKQVQTAATVRSNLEGMANELAIAGTLERAPEVCVEIGDPADKIVALAKARNSNLIVMTTHGYGAVKRTLFGSVTDRVVRSSTVPVLVTRPCHELATGETSAFRRIVVPLDGSTMAETALALASALARHLDLPITLVRAVHFNYVIPAVDGTIAVTVDSTKEMLGSANDYLSSIRDALAVEGLKVCTEARLGLPFDVVDAFARPNDLIILTSHGRGGLGRWLLGSVAEKLVRSARAPVLLVPVHHPARSVTTSR